MEERLLKATAITVGLGVGGIAAEMYVNNMDKYLNDSVLKYLAKTLTVFVVTTGLGILGTKTVIDLF